MGFAWIKRAGHVALATDNQAVGGAAPGPGPNLFTPINQTRWTSNPSFWLIAQIRGLSESLKVRRYR